MSVQDLKGNVWNVKVTTSTIQRVKVEAGIDLMQVLEDRTVLGRLFGDMIAQATVLYWACPLQVTAYQIKSLEEFLDLWDGDTLEQAMDQLFESLAAYFPKQRGRALREGVAATKTYIEKIFDKATVLAHNIQTGTMDKILDQTEEQILKDLQTKTPDPDAPSDGGESSGSVPESSESTQATSPQPS